MKWNVYALKDTKIGYTEPIIRVNDAIMKREFAFLINDANSRFHAIYQDIELYKLGTYDDVTGKMDCCEPKFISNGVEVKKDA